MYMPSTSCNELTKLALGRKHLRTFNFQSILVRTFMGFIDTGYWGRQVHKKE